MTAAVATSQRHRRDRRCPVCGGADGDRRGTGRRCHGYTSADGRWCHCTREDHAGILAATDAGTYAHRLHGECPCGTTHGTALSIVSAEIAYDYRDASGERVYQVVRRSGKKFLQRRPDGNGGWVWDMRGVARVPYRLPELIAADRDRVVYIAEGEKDCDALASAGQIATCNPGGAGKWALVADVASPVLRGRSVVIIADADDAGRRHAADVQRRLTGVADSVRTIEMPHPHKDVTDYLRAGGSVEEIEAMAAVVDPVPTSEPAHATTIDRTWIALSPDLLLSPPPARRWLFRHPDRDGLPAAPGQGDGMLPLGKAGVLSSAGGVGKTHLLIQAAMAIACGKRWLGHFHVDDGARRGRVLLALGEEDHEELHRRMYDGAQALNLTADERRHAVQQIVALPLAGHPCSLLACEIGQTPAASAEYDALRRKLDTDGGDHGWSLIVVDPLARFAGFDTEADNNAATRFVQLLESLACAPGNPTVIASHHSSKMARRAGSVDARGVTGLTDGSRWAATLRLDGAEVLFRQAKSNYSRPMVDDVRLVRERGGLLRVATADEIADRDERTAAAKEDRAEQAIDGLRPQILSAIMAARGPITSRADLARLVSGAQAAKVQAVTRLIADGEIVKCGKVYRVGK